MRPLYLFFSLLWLALSGELAAQSDPFILRADGSGGVIDMATTITAADLRQHVNILASDSLEGRETGALGNVKAAGYIKQHFADWGLQPKGDYYDNQYQYLQNIGFGKRTWQDNQLRIHDRNFKHLYDYYATIDDQPLTANLTTQEVLFIGYGIDAPTYSDYSGIDVRGKTVMFYVGEPIAPDSTSYVTGARVASKWATGNRLKIKTAQLNGAAAVIIIDTSFNKSIQWVRKYALNGSFEFKDKEITTAIPVLYVSGEVAKAIAGDRVSAIAQARDKSCRQGIAARLTLPTQLHYQATIWQEQLESANVIGFIEGSDSVLKKEVVFITAHYDHLGKKGDDIYHGADDNASGTATVLEMAQAFATAHRQHRMPKRSIAIMLVTGEEKGLKGSEYYTQHPSVPLADIVANINIDMVGRIDTFHKHANYIYVIGADKLSTELHDINEQMNQRYIKLELDYKYNDENDPNRFYYRSDHYNFAKNGIPAIFYFNGTHEDYHQPTDTADKIDTQKMERIGRLAFFTAWEIANRDTRLRIDKAEK